MDEIASRFARTAVATDGLRVGEILPVLASAAAADYAELVSRLDVDGDDDAMWNSVASNTAAGWLDDMLTLRPPVIYDSQLDALASGDQPREDARSLADQDKNRLIDGDRHVANLMVLQFLASRLVTIGAIEDRIKQLPTSLRHLRLAPHLEAQIRSATTLFLLGLERECTVFCAAAAEAALESFNGNQAAPLEERGKGKDRRSLLARCIDLYVTDTQLNQDCHALRETRNEHLHPIKRTPSYRRLSGLESLVALVLVLELLAPPPDDPGDFFAKLDESGPK